jgi:hypothetical protein
MMKLIDDLIADGQANAAQVREVRVGISWTGVWGKYCGLSKTYGIPFVHGNYTRDLGRLTDKSTTELAEYAKSWNLVEASIGVAAINSRLHPAKTIDANAQEMILAKAEGKRVSVSGAFPFTPQLNKIAKKVWTLELDASFINPAAGIITETAAEYVIPESDMVIITGSTLINKSMERLLELARAAHAYTVVLGPSTPLSEVLFDYGASLVAGAEVVCPEPVLLKLSQSGGMLDSKICPGEIVFKVMER